MYTVINQGSYDFCFSHDVFLGENDHVTFNYLNMLFTNLDVEINLEGVMCIDENGEYADISAEGCAVFYTNAGEEVSRIYIDHNNFKKFSDSFRKYYKVDLVSKIWDDIDVPVHYEYPTSMSGRI